MGRRYRIVGVVMASMLSALAALTAACSDNGEGERCQAENGNDDCASGLVCLAATSKAFGGGHRLVNEPYNDVDRCCPDDGKTATHPACTLQQKSAGGGDSAPPAETGPALDAPTDVVTETSVVPEAAPPLDANDGGG